MSETPGLGQLEALQDALQRSEREVVLLNLALEKEKARASEAHRQMRQMRTSPGWRAASCVNDLLRVPARAWKTAKRTVRSLLKSVG